jgi:hypothetical protein
MRHRLGSFLAIGALIAVAACDNQSPTTAPVIRAASTLSASLNGGTCMLADGTAAARGFDANGYNDCARIFNGTYSSWCVAGGQVPGCVAAPYTNDKVVMKWNAAWDACNAVGTADACAGAWTDNEVNGKITGGSGEVWHYKIKWVGLPCGPTNMNWSDGGYCIWGSDEVLMDQGIDPNSGDGHFMNALAKPNGYGSK